MVRGADVACFSDSGVPAERAIGGYAEVAAELIAEMLSPFDRRNATRQDVCDHQAMGVEMVLVIDPLEERVHDSFPDRAGHVLVAGESLPLRGPPNGHSIDVMAIIEQPCHRLRGSTPSRCRTKKSRRRRFP